VNEDEGQDPLMVIASRKKKKCY